MCSKEMPAGKVAAIWPLKATKKSEYEVVSVEWIKDFQDLKNHANKLYKYKPPGAKKSSLVFILVTGSSEKEVKEVLGRGRIRYPNKSLIEPNLKVTTSEEEQMESIKEKNKNLKTRGKLSTAQCIIQSHLAKGSKKTQTKENPSSQFTTESTSVAHKSVVVKAPVLGKTTPASNVLSTPSVQNVVSTPPVSNVVSKMTVSKVVSAPPPVSNVVSTVTIPVKGGKNSASSKATFKSTTSVPDKVKTSSSQTDDNIFKRLTALEKNMQIREEEIGLLEAKFESQQAEAQKQNDILSKKLASLERSIKRCSEQAQTEQPPKKISIPSTLTEPSFHLENTKLISLGHNVQADADIWEQLEQAGSKDDWAYGALMSVFGAESKFYRARKPRSKDKNLRLFPNQPPVLLVLKHYYRKWLRDHPNIIDDECAKSKLPNNQQSDWPTIYERETPDERNARRKVFITSLVNHLPGLLADKAINMYRQGRRSSGRDNMSSDEEDNEDNENNGDDDITEYDIVDLSSGEDNFEEVNQERIKVERVTDDESSSNELSPNSLAFMRQQQQIFSTP